jgi:hypothetical protein
MKRRHDRGVRVEESNIAVDDWLVLSPRLDVQVSPLNDKQGILGSRRCR